MILARASAPWKIFCFLLKFLLKKCYKDRFTYKIYNMTYFYVRGGGGGLRSCAISMMGSEHQSWYPLDFVLKILHA